jgi:hypothetical protein
MNPNDEIRDQILRFLHERHSKARSPGAIPIGIMDLNREMKARHNLKQADVAGNVDYLIQAEYVREVRIPRSFKTKGMEVGKDQIKYKISDAGINHIEAGTLFKKVSTANHINITNIKGVTVVGDGNIVNTQYGDLSRALDRLDEAVATSEELSDEEKLSLAGDIGTLRSQVAKPQPSKKIMTIVWESMEKFAAVKSVAEALAAVGTFISSAF